MAIEEAPEPPALIERRAHVERCENRAVRGVQRVQRAQREADEAMIALADARRSLRVWLAANPQPQLEMAL